MRRAMGIALTLGVTIGWGGAPLRPAFALPPAVDVDQDGHLDTLETALGSDPADPASTPESLALQPTCLDGADNDGDGSVDLDDPGCLLPAPSDTTLPGAGDDAFDSALTLNSYQLDTPFGLCTADVEASGPAVVRRGDPVDLGGGLRSIPVEIIAMQLTGTATIMADPGCTLPAGEVPITIYEDPAQASTGTVTDTNPDPTADFPADSFFDVFFVVDTPLGPFPGGPDGGPAGAPVRVENQINTIPPYQGGQNPLCYEVPGLGHLHCPKAPPDHYLCYAAKFRPKFSKREVTLRDQFDTDTGGQHRVLKPVFLCTPASKNGEPLYEPTGHLACYTLKPRKAPNQAVLRTQFGLHTVQVKKSKLLCLPAEKNAEGAPQQLDHFKCYTGKFTPKRVNRDVTLVDQFGALETRVIKPLNLCNPVSKNGEPIHSPLNHLECFKIKGTKVKQTVTVSDQFGDWDVVTKKTKLLCAPASKNAGETTTTTIPGTTTTTVPTGELIVMGGYTHPTPGVPPSILCAKITGPPGAPVGVTATGPGLDVQTSVLLDKTGVGRFQTEIFSFGTYQVQAQLDTMMASDTVNVQAQQSTCP